MRGRRGFNFVFSTDIGKVTAWRRGWKFLRRGGARCRFAVSGPVAGEADELFEWSTMRRWPPGYR
jgi:hypothetical protein